MLRSRENKIEHDRNEENASKCLRFEVREAQRAPQEGETQGSELFPLPFEGPLEAQASANHPNEQEMDEPLVRRCVKGFCDRADLAREELPAGIFNDF